jgi:transcriptional regulator with GAF, ATPase, and Fis domain
VKGAFTGAVIDKIGKFEAADKVLYLDEIGETTEIFGNFCVSQSGEYDKVGSVNTAFTDVRVISATNKELKCLLRKNLEKIFLQIKCDHYNIPSREKKRRY